MLLTLMLPVASKSSHDYGQRIKSAIIPRLPFGDAEKAIILAFGKKYGLEVDFVLSRSGIQATAELVANGTVDIASAGIMTSYFYGKGRFMCKQTYEPFKVCILQLITLLMHVRSPCNLFYQRENMSGRTTTYSSHFLSLFGLHP